MKCFKIAFLLIGLAGCSTKWDIKGSWYTIGHDHLGHYNKDLSYTELYVNDSIISAFLELPGQQPPHPYYIIGDSIFQSFCPEKECEFIPMYKIRKLANDTLWLTINPKWNKISETYWVRLPEGEKGEFDHQWTPQNSDSLTWAVAIDYERRAFRYFSSPQEYDSALRAGRWSWTMQDVRASKE